MPSVGRSHRVTRDALRTRAKYCDTVELTMKLLPSGMMAYPDVETTDVVVVNITRGRKEEALAVYSDTLRDTNAFVGDDNATPISRSLYAPRPHTGSMSGK